MGKKNKLKNIRRQEAARLWQPLTPAYAAPSSDPLHARYEEKEIWKNDLYTVMVTRDMDSMGTKFTWLSIKRNDREPARDWRHFQYIKNQLVGEECEGMEIYPAESRLVDGANQYHLWVLQDPRDRIPFGFTDGRTISEKPYMNAKQRAWEDNMRPKDLEESERRIEEAMESERLKYTATQQ